MFAYAVNMKAENKIQEQSKIIKVVTLKQKYI